MDGATTWCLRARNEHPPPGHFGPVTIARLMSLKNPSGKTPLMLATSSALMWIIEPLLL